MSRILIVEDEKKIARFLELELTHEGYEVQTAGDGRSGLELAQSWQPDLLILDLMLPELSGIEVCRRLRHDSDVPIIMLTAKDDVSDKVMGLDMGADDYMTKPFEAPELLARLRALTRRRGDVLIDEIKFADIRLDLNTHDLSCGEKSVHLSGKEFEVLSILMGSSSRVVSKQDLLTRVWGTDGEASENSVEAYVSFIRKKLTHIGSKVQVTTLRMLGYRLEVL